MAFYQHIDSHNHRISISWVTLHSKSRVVFVCICPFLLKVPSQHNFRTTCIVLGLSSRQLFLWNSQSFSKAMSEIAFYYLFFMMSFAVLCHAIMWRHSSSSDVTLINSWCFISGKRYYIPLMSDSNCVYIAQSIMWDLYMLATNNDESAYYKHNRKSTRFDLRGVRPGIWLHGTVVYTKYG